MATAGRHGMHPNYLTSLLPLALILSLGLSGPASAETGGMPDTSSQPAYKPLQGGVEHDETLPPVDPKYRLGATIDPDQLMNATPDNSWFPIPAWFAGKWHSDEQKILYLKDLETGQTDTDQRTLKESSDTNYGMQRDKSGQIWNYIKVPRTVKVKIAHGTGYQHATREEALQSDQSKVLIKYLYDELDLNNKQKIQAVNQIQTINTYTPVEDGLVRLSASIKSFDADGEAKILQKGEKMAKRTAPYQNIDTDGDLDLKKLFVEFLTKAGRQDLIPDSK